MSGPLRIPEERYRERLAAARMALDAADVSALMIGVGPELQWLTGYPARPSERLTMLVVSRGAPSPVLIVPALEEPAARLAPAVASGDVRLEVWSETSDPIAIAARTGVVSGAEVGSRALVSDTLRAAFLLRLQAALGDTSFASASSIVGPLRTIKDADEIRILRDAAHGADRVIAAIAAGRLVGRSESDVAREVRDRLVDEGHDDASFWIVASGPNSASPHHDASDRVIAPGDPIVLDIGGSIAGYGSDITRTIWVTGGDDAHGPTDEFRRLYRVLQGAHGAATAAARAGTPCEAVDAAAREPITAAGFGDRFIHRTGHGIGLEGHEDPYLVAGNGDQLAAGNAFSVEPGIYLEGRYGARIEDIVVCTDGDPDVLNGAPRDLLVVAGL